MANGRTLGGLLGIIPDGCGKVALYANSLNTDPSGSVISVVGSPLVNDEVCFTRLHGISIGSH